MRAVLTSKGQITLPKPIRDQLGLEAGTALDFVVEPDGSLRARPLKRGADGLFGLLRDPDDVPGTIEEMDAAVDGHLRGEDERCDAGNGS
jgi:antitoxin PrlF